MDSREHWALYECEIAFSARRVLLISAATWMLSNTGRFTNARPARGNSDTFHLPSPTSNRWIYTHYLRHTMDRLSPTPIRLTLLLPLKSHKSGCFSKFLSLRVYVLVSDIFTALHNTARVRTASECLSSKHRLLRPRWCAIKWSRFGASRRRPLVAECWLVNI